MADADREIFGTTGNDTLTGFDNSRDSIDGGAGNDSLSGLTGDDTLVGGAGFDTLSGQGGNDLLLGGESSDTLNGGGGNDTLDGGLLTDTVNNSDRNTGSWNVSTGLTSGANINLATGIATDGLGGTDTLLNISGVQGTSLNDTITGSGTERMYFEQFEGLGGNDTIDGGAIDLASGFNANRVTYQSVTGGAGVNVTLNGPDVDGTATGAAGNDVLRNINQVQGTNFNDTLTGSDTTAWSESFGGGAGNDTIDGKGGNDQVRYDGATKGVSVTLTAGSLDVAATVADDGQGGTDTLLHIEGVRGSNFNDTLTGSNTAGTANDFEFFQGNAGNDTIDGMGGFDRVDYGSATTGVVVAFTSLVGDGTASDGQGGTDTLINIEAIRGSEYSDTLTGSDRTDRFESFEGRAGNDVIDGKGGADRADYNNDFGPVTVNLAFGLANDGFGGTDILRGIEMVRGSQYADSITGSAGNDTITGNGGADTLMGNGGADVFTYGNGIGNLFPGLDLILDFGTDDALEVRVGNTVQSTSTSGDGSTVTNHEMQVSTTNGITRLFIDTDGVAGANVQLTLLGTYSGTGFTIAAPQSDGTSRITYSGAVTPPGTISGVTTSSGTTWHDSIVGTTGNDTLSGGNGNDTIVGDTGADSLSGGAGGDVLVGGAGNDTLDGGAIVDRTNNSDRNFAIYESGSLAPTTGINLNLSDTLANGQAAHSATDGFGGTDTLANISFVRATHFADTLQGSSEINLFEHFEPFGGNDLVNGGAIDTLTGSNFNRVSYEGATNQVVINMGITSGPQVTSDGFGGQDTLVNINYFRGGDVGDSLTGSNPAGVTEIFDGGGGNDTIDGAGGTDIVRYERSTAGVNVTIGASGTAVTQDMGTDTLLNIEGVRGSEFADTLTGSDTSATQGALEIFQGGAGNDTINGGGGFDRADYQSASFGVVVNLSAGAVNGIQAGTALDGQGGIDTLNSVEFVRGSDFNDYFIGSELSGAGLLENFEGRAGDDTIDGRGGVDRVDYSNDLPGQNNKGVYVDLSSGYGLDGWGGRDTLLNIENIRGSGFNDTLLGSSSNNTIEGRFGDDWIDGGAGSDTMFGGTNGTADTGIDTFVVSSNPGDIDRIADLQAGEKIMLPSHNGDFSAAFLTDGTNLGNGVISFSSTLVNSATRVTVGLDNTPGADLTFDIVGTFSANSFVLSFTRGDGPQGLLYRPGAVTLPGSAGDDDLFGSNFNDSLTGGTGADILVGFKGNDTLDGGDGDDHFGGDPGSDSIIGGLGFDMVHYDFNGAFTTGVVANLTTNLVTNGTDVDTLSGIEGVSGSFFGDTIVGYLDGNFLEGWEGNDVILGQDTSDHTFTGAYVGAATAGDTIYGGSGDDTIRGSSGNDQLAGRSEDNYPGEIGGADKFVFAASGNGVDTILDFADDDAIGILNVALTAGPALQGSGTSATTVSGKHVEVTTTGTGSAATTTLYIDTDGNAGAEVVINLSGSYVASQFSVTPNAQNAPANTSGITYTYPAQTISGTPNADNQLNGGLGADTISGLSGNDSIDGNGGNDSLLGGDDNDTIAGGPGNDFIDGGLGFDYWATGNYPVDGGVLVNLGTQTASAQGLGTDTVIGIEGAFGTFQNDTMFGDGADNSFDGNQGNDSLVGAGGNDLLTGNGGSDTLNGGLGNDIFDVKDSGGGDVDRIEDLSSGDVIQLNFTPNQMTLSAVAASSLLANQFRFDTTAGVTRISIGVDGIAGADRYVDIVGTVSAGDFLRLGQVQAGGQFRFGDMFMYDTTASVAKNLNGSENNDTLLGSNAADSLNGNGGNDTLYGFDGNDRLNGNAGGDNLRGGFGDDTLDGGADFDVVDFTFSGSIGVNVNLGNGNGTAVGEGNDVLLSIEGVMGAGGNDTFTGDDGSNQLFGNFGNDSLVGGGGGDWISAGNGNDTMSGGADNDLFAVDQGANGETDQIDDFAVGDALQLAFSINGWTLLGQTGGAGLLANQMAFGSSPLSGYTRLFLGTDSIAGSDRTVDIKGTLTAGDFVKLSQMQVGIFSVTGDIFQYQTTSPQTINGTGASETLAGGGGNDTISGFAGGDSLQGNAGDDSLLGGDDGDFLDGGAGNDTLVGGNGIDTAYYGFAGNGVNVNLGAGTATGQGNDVIAADVEQVIGSSFNDTLTGSTRDDTLMGMDGNDTLDGGDGNDRFDGGTGADSIVGGNGDDIAQYGFWGNTNAVTFTVAASGIQADGMGSTDTLVGIEQVHVFGGSGNDSFTGSAAREFLEGNQGNDTLTGGGGDDTFAWQPNLGDLGRDRVTDAGVGDSLHFRGMTLGTVAASDATGTGLMGGQVGVSYNAGTNTTTIAVGLDANPGGDLFIDLTGQFSAAQFQVYNDVANGYGNLNIVAASQPTTGNDNLQGTLGADTIDALDGNDTVSGNDGNDSLLGNNGNDNLFGGAGNDTLLGGAGDDWLEGGSGSDSLDGGVGGFDTVAYTFGGQTSAVSITITGSPAQLMTQADGMGGIDTLNGFEQVNFYGGQGNDTFTGSVGREFIEGAEGNDSLTGGGGNDTFAWETNMPNQLGRDRITDFNAGDSLHLRWMPVTSVVDGGSPGTLQRGQVSMSYDSGTNTTTVSVGFDTIAGADLTFDMTGEFHAANFSIGNDTVNGHGNLNYGGAPTGTPSAGNDTLTGTANNDSINALAGNDSISGLDGDDTIEGGPGSDTIDGGNNTGAGDWVVYSSATAGVSVNLGAGTPVSTDGTGGGAFDLIFNVENVAGTQYNDTLQGTTGNNTFRPGLGNDSVIGDSGTDTVRYDELSGGITVDLTNASATVTGAAGTDTLTGIENVHGTQGDDTIILGATSGQAFGRAGNDSLLGGGLVTGPSPGLGTNVDDNFWGGSGNDTINGGAGFDTANYDQTGNDSGTVTGNGVNVNLANGTATDNWGNTDTLISIEIVTGSDFNDTLVGGVVANDGFEGFRGGKGNDTIDGGTGFDRAYYDTSTTGVSVTLGGLSDGTASDGWGGTDTLRNIEEVRGSAFNDTLTGSDRTDTTESFEARGGNDLIDGRGGFDRVNFQTSTNAVSVDLSQNRVFSDGFGGIDTLAGIEAASGGSGNDTLVGDGNANDLVGRAGDDSLSGGGGQDTLTGGAGNDTLDGGTQRILLGWGNTGNLSPEYDIVSYSDFTTAVNVDLGDGTNGTATGTSIGTDVLRDIEFVIGSNSGDVLRGTNRGVNEIFRGGLGDDTIFGGQATGTDAGPNFVDYRFANGAVQVNLSTGAVTGADGNDQLNGIGNVLGSGFNDSLVGNASDNYFEGNGGDDTIDGGAGTGDRVSYQGASAGVNVNLGNGSATGAAGNDSLVGIEQARGSEWADTLTGSAADNWLQGRNGNDTIDAAGGNDTVQGGFGDDSLTGGTGNDAFRFEPDDGAMGRDRITDFGTGDVIQIAGLSVSGVSAGDGTGLLRGQVHVGAFNSGTNTTTVLIGLDSVGGADLSIDLTGNYTAANFTAGNDTVAGLGLLGYTSGPTINPTEGNDNLTGTSGPDTINALGGNDNVSGLDGNDSLLGGNGDDFLDGGAGNDTLDGGANGQWGDTIGFGSATTGVNVNLGTNSVINDGTGGTDTLLNVEHVNGTQFNDTLVGSSIVNWFHPGDGNDSVVGNGTPSGFDVVMYQEATGAITINLLTGSVTGAAGTDTLVGIGAAHATNFADTVTMSNNGGYVFAGAGNDTLIGGNGSDDFKGGSGNDSMSGGGGTDTADYSTSTTTGDAAGPGLSQGVVVNLVTGTATDNWGNTDTLSSIEQVWGSDFNDTLIGGNPASGSGATDGYEGFRGNAGSDSIAGGTGFDRLFYDTSTTGVTVQLGGLGTGTAQDGWGGTDTFTSIEEVRGSDFADTLLGTSDNVFESFEGRGGNDSIDGGVGGGANRISYSTSTNAVTVNLVMHTASDGFGGTDTFANIQYARGGSGNDTIIGDAQDNSIEGQNGNDSLTGGDGADTLNGQGGNDTLDGGSQRMIFGWAASANESPTYDFASFTDSSAGVTVDLGVDGTNGSATGTAIGTDKLVDIEYILGSAFNDVIRGSNRQVNEILRGNQGDDTLIGGQATGTDAGSNFVSYQNATGGVNVNLSTNSASGADGNDSISGINNVLGSAYNDTIVGNSADNYIDAFGGADSIDGGAGTADKISYQNATTAVNLNLVTGRATAEGAEDTITGMEWVRGSEFSDTLTGDGNDNWIQGRNGNDTIDAAGGADTLHGGYGDDVLTGGAGNDAFLYGVAGGEGLDRITDFAVGDVIRFDGLLAGGTVSVGSNPAGKGVSAVNGTGFTTLYIDTDGNAGAETQIRLDGTFDIAKFSVTNVGGQALIEYDKPPGVKIDGQAYTWKTHVLLDNVTVSANTASAVTASSDLFDLRGMTYDAATNSVSMQVWVNPTTGIGSVGFTLTSQAGTAFEFTGAPANWLVESNVPGDAPHSFIVQGAIGNGGSVSTAFQLGTVKITLAANTTSTSFDFSAINVDTQVPAGFSVGMARQVTGNDGQYHFTTVPTGDYGVSATRGTTDMGSAINSADALAALRIAVGTNPNSDPDGAGPLSALKLSPYQVIAADANKDGLVNSADALAILRMAVKAGTAPANEWLFVNEKLDLWNEAAANGGASALTRTAAGWSNPATTVNGDSVVNFVAVLKGDVNGTWAPANGAGNLDLDNTNPTYFQNLATQLGVPTDIWGV